MNIKNIKVAIFDFDDTLAIHQDKDYSNKRNESEEALFNYYLSAYLNPKTFYDEIEKCNVSNKLLEFINYLRTNN